MRREDVQREWECEKGGRSEGGNVRREDVQRGWSVRRGDVQSRVRSSLLHSRHCILSLTRMQ